MKQSIEKEEALSKTELRDLLRYDHKTGMFWRKSRTSNRIDMNKPAGYVCKSGGYVHIHLKGTSYLAHRLVFLYVYGTWPREEVDHIDGDRSNNTLQNLREVTGTENHKNMKGKPGCVLGVRWMKGRNKWRARITHKGVETHLGMFSSYEEAVLVREAAQVEFGFHKNHGRDLG